ncbi:MAG: TonB-dependent receptor plug domain-containing protein [Syntrophorhabdus sp.]
MSSSSVNDKKRKEYLVAFGILVACLFLCTRAVAQEVSLGTGVFTLGEIEVTAKGEENKNIKIDKVSDEEMREFNRETVGNALNLLPGVTLSQVGARNEGMIYVRGLDLKHVPIYLDGIPIYIPYDGYPDLNRFTTFDLSQIVLSKGFTSVLYGPNTMGGAINLVSRRPEKAFEGNAGIGVFTGNGYEGYANFGTNQKLWYFQGGASYLNNDYFVLSDDLKPTVNKTENGGQRENSYYRDRKFNLKFGFTPAEGHEYVMSYWDQHGVKGVPPYAGTDPSTTPRYWQWPYWDKEGYYFNSRTPLGDKSYVKTRFYWDRYTNSLYAYDDATYTTITRRSSFRSDYHDNTYGGSAELGTSLLPYNLIKVAGLYKIDVHKEHNLPSPYQTFKDEIFSIGAEDTITITNKFYAIVGLSYDRQKSIKAEDWNVSPRRDFAKAAENAWNPQAGLFYSLTDTGKLSLTFEEKTRFPSLKDRYSYRLGTAIPNPDLEPERARNYELGYQGVLFKRVSLKTAIFYRDIKDFFLSITIPNPSGPGTVSQNQNVGHVEQYGFELDLSAPIIKTLDAGVNYTYLDNNNRSSSDKLTDVPEHKFFVYAKYTPVKGLSLLADVEKDSKRWSDSRGVRVAKGYTVANIKAMYEIIRGLQIEAGVRNVFDNDYELNEGFPMPGRLFFANLTYRF